MCTASIACTTNNVQSTSSTRRCQTAEQYIRWRINYSESIRERNLWMANMAHKSTYCNGIHSMSTRQAKCRYQTMATTAMDYVCIALDLLMQCRCPISAQQLENFSIQCELAQSKFIENKIHRHPCDVDEDRTEKVNARLDSTILCKATPLPKTTQSSSRVFWFHHSALHHRHHHKPHLCTETVQCNDDDDIRNKNRREKIVRKKSPELFYY